MGLEYEGCITVSIEISGLNLLEDAVSISISVITIELKIFYRLYLFLIFQLVIHLLCRNITYVVLVIYISECVITPTYISIHNTKMYYTYMSQVLLTPINKLKLLTLFICLFPYFSKTSEHVIFCNIVKQIRQFTSQFMSIVYISILFIFCISFLYLFYICLYFLCFYFFCIHFLYFISIEFLFYISIIFCIYCLYFHFFSIFQFFCIFSVFQFLFYISIFFCI